MTALIGLTPDAVTLRTPFALANVCRSIVGGRWDKANRCWTYPATMHGAANVLTALKANGVPFGFDSEATQARIAGMVGQLVKVEAIQTADPATFPDIPGAKLKPWKHQNLGYQMICNQEATYLIWEMGCGKTLPVVCYIEDVMPKLCLIVAPLAAVPVWPREFEKHGRGHSLVVALHTGDIQRRIARADMAIKRAMSEERPCVVVVNYEALYRDDFVKWAMAQPWNLICGDELHKIKSPSGVASRALAALGKKAGKRIGLTGTPMHSPMDLYGQFRFLEPGIFGTSFLQFRGEYAIMGGYKQHEVVAYKNTDKLRQKLFSIAHRITAKEALPFLPGFRYSPRYIELSAEGKAAYATMKRDMLVKIGSGEVTAANALAKLLRLQQITSGYLVTEERIDAEHVREVKVRLDDGKRKALEEFLNEEAESTVDQPDGMASVVRDPVVVFCRFTHDLAEVRAAAEACGRRYFELSGAEKQWEDWQYGQSDKQPENSGDVIGVQIQAGGAGIDLTRARFCVDYSVGFSLIDYLQSRKRTLRPGQKRDVTYVQLIASGTVDEQIYSSLLEATAVAENLLQKGADFTGETRDIGWEIFEAMKHEAGHDPTE